MNISWTLAVARLRNEAAFERSEKGVWLHSGQGPSKEIWHGRRLEVLSINHHLDLLTLSEGNLPAWIGADWHGRKPQVRAFHAPRRTPANSDVRAMEHMPSVTCHPRWSYR